MDRRRFLTRLAQLGITAATPWTAARVAMAGVGLDGGGLNQAQWRTLDVVQRHLFPNEAAAPGAAEIHAAPYLYFVLSDTTLDPDERALIPAGLVAFQRRVQDSFNVPFDQLTATQRETALRAFEATPQGREWLTRLLGYLFEALLTDPVYGGNPDGIGWHWLDHRPGFPRPPRDKRYFLL